MLLKRTGGDDVKKFFIIISAVFVICFCSYSSVEAGNAKSNASITFYEEENKATDNGTKTGQSTSPKTGEASYMAFILLAISSLVIILLLIMEKKKRTI